MSRSVVNRSIALSGAVALAAASLTVRAQEAPPQQLSPPGVGRTRQLLGDLQGLLRANIALGLVLGPRDAFTMTVTVREQEAPPETQNRSAAIGAFKHRWRHLFAVSESGSEVNVFSPRASRCSLALKRPVHARSFEGPSWKVLIDVVESFDPAPNSVPPSLVSGGGESGPDDALTRMVRIETNPGETLLDALSALTRASPGVGWYAAESCDVVAGPCSCGLGLLTPTSVVSPSDDVAAGLPEPSDTKEPVNSPPSGSMHR